MKDLKKRILGCILLVVFCFIGLVVSQIVLNNDKTQAQETEEATPIREGEVTDRQREHGKLFKGYGIGKKIKDLIKGKEEISLVKGPPLVGEEFNVNVPNLATFLQEATCRSDAVVVGVVNGKESQLTDDGEFVFTDYEVVIETVLKQGVDKSVGAGGSLYVTKPGGKLLFNGRTVIALDKASVPLIKNRKYLFFLKRIATTGGYLPQEGTILVLPSSGRLQTLTESTGENLLNNQDYGVIADMILAFALNSCGSFR